VPRHVAATPRLRRLGDDAAATTPRETTSAPLADASAPSPRQNTNANTISTGCQLNTNEASSPPSVLSTGVFAPTDQATTQSSATALHARAAHVAHRSARVDGLLHTGRGMFLRCQWWPKPVDIPPTGRSTAGDIVESTDGGGRPALPDVVRPDARAPPRARRMVSLAQFWLPASGREATRVALSQAPLRLEQLLAPLSLPAVLDSCSNLLATETVCLPSSRIDAVRVVREISSLVALRFRRPQLTVL